MKPMTKIVIYSVIVLLMDGIIMKINYSPLCWGPPGTSSRTPGGPQTPLREPLLYYLYIEVLLCVHDLM